MKNAGSLCDNKQDSNENSVDTGEYTWNMRELNLPSKNPSSYKTICLHFPCKGIYQ